MNATIERTAGAGLAAAHGSDLYSWEVSVKGTDWTRIVNAKSSGQAKSDYHRDLSDPWPDIPYTALRCRKIGKPHTSKQFVRNAEYRWQRVRPTLCAENIRGDGMCCPNDQADRPAGRNSKTV